MQSLLEKLPARPTSLDVVRLEPTAVAGKVAKMGGQVTRIKPDEKRDGYFAIKIYWPSALI